MIQYKLTLFITLLFFTFSSLLSQQLTYPIVDTGVEKFYNNNSIISEPNIDNPFYGQDAHYKGNQPSYTDNGNGLISDNVTGLMWQQDMGDPITFFEALEKADTMTLGGYSDWRVPTIKELYSLILFTGRVKGETPYEKFIDTNYFNQPIGNTDNGDRLIDAQTFSITEYTSTTMNGDSTVFGVNFLDGRIKGYPKYEPWSNNTTPIKKYFRMVRGNQEYGENNFNENGDGTITDNATGLMWQKTDDGYARDWEEALSYSENLNLAGYNDWRLPNAKELQSIVDYTRCPDKTNSPAISPLFNTTEIEDPDGNPGQYPYFWTSTTHLDGINPYSAAVYIAFGKAQGKMNNMLLDVHGAGSQRSDPKTGNPTDYPEYFGPQGDVRYVFNYVRCVRDISTTSVNESESDLNFRIYPNPAENFITVLFDEPISFLNLSILDIFGETIMEYNLIKNKNLNIPVKELAKGIYFMKITYKDKIKSIKFLKK